MTILAHPHLPGVYSQMPLQIGLVLELLVAYETDVRLAIAVRSLVIGQAQLVFECSVAFLALVHSPGSRGFFVEERSRRMGPAR